MALTHTVTVLCVFVAHIVSETAARSISEMGNSTFEYSNRYVFTSEVGERRAEKICQAVGLTYRSMIPTLRKTYYVCVEPQDDSKRKKRQTNARNVDTENALKSQMGVENAHQEVYVPVTTDRVSKRSAVVTDPQWDDMWHLQPSHQPSMHVYEAWNKGYTGNGIIVGVVDSGIDEDHEDLVVNYRPDLSYDHLSGDNDPSHSSSDSGHGTSCAGIVAAGKNLHCSIGVAYDAEFAAIRRLDVNEQSTVSTVASSLLHQYSTLDIYSNSWGYRTEGKGYVALDAMILDAMETGVTEGRGGKGSLYVFSAGNGESDYDDANAQGIKTSRYTIIIGSVSPDGTPAYYTNPCACLLASTYGGDLSDNNIGIITADRDNGCRTDFQGTSAACPVASGIIALTLQANPDLTWRDIQHLIVETAITSGLSGDTFTTNGAGYRVSNYFGFGLMDAEQMVTNAKSWTNVASEASCNTGYIYPDSYTTYYDVTDNKIISCDISKLEHVVARIAMYSSDWGNVAIYLTSPAGTRSRLMRHRHLNEYSDTAYWDYSSTHFWGENADGKWKVELEDSGYSAKRLVYWRLTMYGIRTSSANGLQAWIVLKLSAAIWLCATVM